MKNNQKNNDRNSLLFSIIAVLGIIALVGGSTYAAWQWRSDESNKTNVSFTIPAGQEGIGLYANLAGNGSVTATKLKPSSCTSSSAIKKAVTLTYANETNQSARITATLSVSSFTIRNQSYQPSSANLANLKYVLNAGGSSNCTSPVKSGSFNAVTFTPGSIAGSTPNLFDLVIDVPAGTAETTRTYTLWIWLDSAYTHENVGSNNTDPMQGLTLTTQWSGQIEQVVS